MGNSTNRPNPVRSRGFSGMSFRARLSWANVLIVALAIAGTAIYTFYRTGLTNTFLANQVNESALRQTENELKSTATRHAVDLDNFFESTASNMATLGTSIQSLLTQENILGSGNTWNAQEKLFRLPQGSWDNRNTEAGSVFVPAQDVLSDTLIAELNTVKQIDFIAPSMLKKNPDMVALYFGSLEGETLYYPNIDLSAILPPDFNVSQRPWFIAATPGNNPAREVVWSEPYQDAALHGLVVTSSVPIYDLSNRFRGVVAVDLQLTKISNLIASIRIGETGYAFVIDKEGRIIAMPEAGYADFELSAEEIEGEKALEPILTKVPLEAFQLFAKMVTNQSGMRTVTLNGVEKYVAYQPIPSVGYSLGVVVPVIETQSTILATRERVENESRRTLINIILSTIILLAVALLFSRWMGNTMARPVVQLTETATRLAEGDLSAEASSQTQDEIGVLANAFNVMASRVRDLVTSLEQRVAERTAELESATQQSRKRAGELQTVSEVARAISTEVNLEGLLTLITNVVSERFGFYHVGVFLLDHTSRNAVLRASNSPGGKRMVGRGHKLPVGQVGIVGHVAASGEPRIALDVGEDATFFNNPDLPETRSEMALPLSLRGRIIGILDVQSTASNAFTQADVETLSILSDQIAIAIENARLLAESQQALAESQALYGEYIGRTWERKTAKNVIGYYHSGGGGQLIDEPVAWEEIRAAFSSGRTVSGPVDPKKEAGAAIAVPIHLQNQIIGILDIRAPKPDHVWSEDEVAVIEAVSERLGLALENARLFEETSGRAAREHAVAEITSKIREATDPQVMIRTAIEELQRVLGVSRVEIIPQVVPTHAPSRDQAGEESR